MAWFGSKFYAQSVTNTLFYNGLGLMSIGKGRLQQDFVQPRHHLSFFDQRDDVNGQNPLPASLPPWCARLLPGRLTSTAVSRPAQNSRSGLRYGAAARYIRQTRLTRRAQVVQRVGGGAGFLLYLPASWFLVTIGTGAVASAERASGGGHDCLFYGIEGLGFAGPVDTGLQCSVASNFRISEYNGYCH